jgi:hypothetical protein
MQAHDSPFCVLARAAHVVLPGTALCTHPARPAHSRDHEIPPPEPFDRSANFFDDAKIFVTENQELFAFRSFTEGAIADVRVGRAQTHAEHLHRDLIGAHFWIRHVAHVNAVFNAWSDDDRVHD